MKKKYILSIALFIIVAIVVQACQSIKIPMLSPKAVITQQIGLGDVTVTYSRPALRGRQMLGSSYIPYGKVYRMGANDATVIRFTEDMQIKGNNVPKGSYALMAVPEATEWTIILNKDAKQWGAYSYKESEDYLRFKVTPSTLVDKQEVMAYNFESIYPDSSILVFRWENTELRLPIFHNSEAEVEAAIKRKANSVIPTRAWLEGAEYYLMKGKNLEEALVLSDKVLRFAKSPFTYNLKAQIAQKLGKCAIAIEAANNTISIVNKRNNSQDAAAKTLAEGIISSCNTK